MASPNCPYCLKYPIHNPNGLRYGILSPDGILPTENADKSLNLHCPRLTAVAPGQDVTIDTCIGFLFPAGTVGLVFESFLDQPFKVNWDIFGNDRLGSVQVNVCNESNQTLEIQPGEVFAKMIVTSEEMIDDVRMDEYMQRQKARYCVVSRDGIKPTKTKDTAEIHCPKLTVVAPRERVLIDTGVEFVFPGNMVGNVCDKPSPGKLFLTESFTHDGLEPVGSEPLVVSLRNLSDQTLKIQRGQVIAQIILSRTDDTHTHKK